jgi:uncharacterized delta-60 repeat protein
MTRTIRAFILGTTLHHPTAASVRHPFRLAPHRVSLRALALLTLFLSLSIINRSAAQPGTLDPTFGEGGLVVIENEGFTAVGEDGAGRLLAVSVNASFETVVRRTLADGSPDETYGTDGALTIVLGAALLFLPTDIVVLDDGSAYLSGGLFQQDEVPEFPALVVLRITEAGALDAPFGEDGVVVFDGEGHPPFVNDALYGAPIAADPAGGVFVAGAVGETPAIIAVARLDAAGALDPSFDSNPEDGVDGLAIAFLDPNTGNPAFLGVDEAGRVTVAGTAATGRAQAEAVAARFEPDGPLDAGFGDGGVAYALSPSGFNTGLGGVLTEAGLVMAGYDRAGSTVQAYAVRLDPSGAIDPSFGDGGFVFAPGPSGFSDSNGSVAVDEEGRLLLAAHRLEEALFDDLGEWLVFRFLADGTPDAAFGDGGTVLLDDELPEQGPAPSLVLTDDSAVLAGVVQNEEATFVAAVLARLQTTAGTSADPAPAALAAGAPFPNPTGGTVRIPLGRATSDVRVETFDVLGRRVLPTERVPAGTPTATVDLETLPAGVYLVRLTDGRASQTHRVVRY